MVKRLFIVCIAAVILFFCPALLAVADNLSSMNVTSRGGRESSHSLISEISDLDDSQMIILARKMIQKGRYKLALNILGHYYTRENRNSDMDFEAAVLRETCRELLDNMPAAARRGAARPRTKDRLIPSPIIKLRRRPPKINAVQVFVFSSPDFESLTAELENLKSRGVDTIIVRAFQNQGDRPLIKGLDLNEPGVYFRTEEAPIAADVMTSIVRKAHQMGIIVFAWITTRRNDWLISRHPEWLEYQYDFDLGRSVPSRSLSIFQGGVREKIKSLIRDLASTGVDGILFQDDLIMRYNEGFSNLASQMFLMETGRGIHPDDLYIISDSPGNKVGFRPLFREWSRWKNRQLMSFLDELIEEARRINPSLLTAVNVYYESILKPENGLAWYAQDTWELLNHGVDFLALMSYHRQIKSELSLDDKQLTALLEQVVKRSKELEIDESRIIFKIQTTDWESIKAIPDQEWKAVRDFFREAGNFSIALLQS